MIDLIDLANEIKESLGDWSRDKIVADLGRVMKKDTITCPVPQHNDNNPSAQWKGDAFYCYSCNSQYDIFNHYDIHHNAEFIDVIKELAQAAGIHIDTHLENYKPNPDKIKINRNFDTSQYKRAVTQETSAGDQFLDNNRILKDVAEAYGVKFSETEVFFRHAEMINGIFQEVFAKRRKLNGANYKYEDIDTKELSLKDGIQCLFGLKTLNSQPYTIITEGHKDALILASMIKEMGMSSLYCVLSVANGSGSLKTSIENSPTFWRYYNSDKCKNVILIPDADEAGFKMALQADKIIEDDRFKWIDLSQIEGISKGTDIADLLELGYNLEELLELQDYLPMNDITSAIDVDSQRVKFGYPTGFLTLDRNDGGLKSGKMTMLVGTRGTGKTTLVRQMISTLASQKIRVHVYLGEGSVGEFKDEMALVHAESHEKECEEDDSTGKKLWYPREAAIDKFDKTLGRFISFSKSENMSTENAIYDNLTKEMNKGVQRGVKVFVIDSMTTLTIGSTDNKRFAMQDKIMAQFVEFLHKHKNKGVHIFMLAHPKSGEGNQKITGAANQENLVDTILRYSRTLDLVIPQLSDADNENVSAIVTTEKIRNRGSYDPCYLEFNADNAQLREINILAEYQEHAKAYELKNWWTRPGESPQNSYVASTVSEIEADQKKKREIANKAKTRM